MAPSAPSPPPHPHFFIFPFIVFPCLFRAIGGPAYFSCRFVPTSPFLVFPWPTATVPFFWPYSSDSHLRFFAFLRSSCVPHLLTSGSAARYIPYFSSPPPFPLFSAFLFRAVSAFPPLPSVVSGRLASPTSASV